MNVGLAFEAVCLLKGPTTHPVAPAPVTVAAVPSVSVLLPVIKFPVVKPRFPFTAAEEVNVTPAALLIVKLFNTELALIPGTSFPVV